jgi:phage repressor protein C with HTH and peptisase S24 domain
MDRAQRIRGGLDAAGRKQAELAAYLKISPQNLQRIIDGAVVKSKHLARLAEYLGCSLQWLQSGTGRAPSWWTPPAPPSALPAGPGVGGRSLPLVGKVAAGKGDVEWWQDRPLEFHLRDSWSVMRVEGDSAYPVVWPNQFVVIDTSGRKPEHNNLVVIQAKEGDTVRSFLKRYCVAPNAPGGYVLASVDAGRDSPYIDPDTVMVMVRVVGVLFEE